MASKVEICNRALQKLGAKRIQSLTSDTPNARSCNVAYEPVKEAELRKHTWNTAVKRASIAADAVAPIFGRSNFFTLPTDFLRLLNRDPDRATLLPGANTVTLETDWQIERGKIITDDDAPLEIRYVFNLDDPNEMDSLFREAFATALAIELAEEITESNSKKDGLKDDYRLIIADAKKVNAIENVAAIPPEDFWITRRR